jgi:hypothetical protein
MLLLRVASSADQQIRAVTLAWPNHAYRHVGALSVDGSDRAGWQGTDGTHRLRCSITPISSPRALTFPARRVSMSAGVDRALFSAATFRPWVINDLPCL